MRDALEALVKAFADAHAELKAGRLPPAPPLKEARMIWSSRKIKAWVVLAAGKRPADSFWEGSI
jgi:hypothetical protein